MEIRVNREDKLVANRTGQAVTAGEWFIYHPDHGGYYGDGKREGVEDWEVLVSPDEEAAPEAAADEAPATS